MESQCGIAFVPLLYPLLFGLRQLCGSGPPETQFSSLLLVLPGPQNYVDE